MEAKYLIKICPESNNNKYYRMIPGVPTDGQFTVEYGRVGSKGLKATYSLNFWDKVYSEKISKGYVDQSNLHQDVIVPLNEGEHKPIEDSDVRSLVSKLQMFANKMIKKHYKLQSKDVTQAMIDKANNIIAILGNTTSLKAFNDTLLELFATIPRKMKNVSDFLATSEKDIPDIISNEQDLLDVMATKVKQDTTLSKKTSGGITILEKMGMDIRLCNDQEIANIKKFMGEESVPKFKRAFRVENKETETAFKEYIKAHKISKRNIHFYYHGSKNENFWGIITQGLKLNPNAAITGKAFGHGIYFATRAKKSINYTSLNGSFWAKGTSETGYLAVYKVAYKKPLDVYSHNNAYVSYTSKDMLRHGTDALFAHKGSMLINDEIIVYNESQATIRYLIELA